MNPSDFRAQRQALNLSQKHIAERAGTTQSCVSHYERGRPVAGHTVMRLVAALEQAGRNGSSSQVRVVHSQAAILESDHPAALGARSLSRRSELALMTRLAGLERAIRDRLTAFLEALAAEEDEE